MSKMARSSMTVGFALASALALGGCSAGGDNGATAASGDVIYITNTPIGTNEFLLTGQRGAEQVAETLGVEAQIYESTDEQSRRANIEAAVGQAPAVIVLITFDFMDLSLEYAQNNPDQEFLVIDVCPEGAPENLHCALFNEEEGSYLAGVEAGYLTSTGKVGSVGAVDNPFIHRYSDAFAAGAQSVDPAITDSQLFIGGSNPFSDPATAKEQALSLINSGVDATFALAAASNSGIFEAATQTGTYTWGVDVNQCPDAPGRIVDNVIKQVDVVIVDLVQQIVAGTAAALTEYGVESNGLSLTSLQDDAADSGCVVMEHPDVLEAVKAARDQIISGEIVPPGADD